MPTVRCNGHDLHYADAGHGDPLVFLNGLAGDHLYWMGQVRALRRRFRCLALDNRDVGQSYYAAAGYSVADLADDVAAFLDTLQLPAAHVVGLSLGGMIGLEMALRHPGRVRSLFLSGTLARCDGWFAGTLDAFTIIRRNVADTAAFFEAVLPWLVSHRFFAEPDRVDWLRALLRRNPHPQRLDGFLRQVEAIRRHDTLARLPEITFPVLVTAGEDDVLAPPRYAAQIYEGLPRVQLETLPGVGHAPPIEDPQTFNRLLAGFLP
jgi:pimeloyl-ACP methyl ester carboxylesterase